MDIRINQHFNDQELEDGLLKQVFKDQSNFYWYTSESGLVRFDGNKFTHYKYKGSNFSEMKDIGVEGQRYIWFKEKEGECLVFDTKLQNYDLTDSIMEHLLFDVDDVYQYDKCWYVVEGDSLGRFNFNKNHQKAKRDKLMTFLGDFIKMKVQENQIMILTTEFLYIYDILTANTLCVEYKSLNLGVNDICAIYFDKETVMLSDDGMNLYRFYINKRKWYEYSIDDKESMPINNIIKLQEEEFLLNSKNAIYQFNFSKDKEFSIQKINEVNPSLFNLLNNYISDVKYDKTNNSLWIASNDNGLVEVKLLFNKLKNIELPAKISIINDIVEDRDGYIWLATHGSGIYKSLSNKVSDDLAFEHWKVNDEVKFHSICKDINEYIIIASANLNDGIYRIVNSRAEKLNIDIAILNRYVKHATKMIVGRNNHLWIIGSCGVVVYDLEKDKLIVSSFFDEDYGEGMCVDEDYYGNIWLGTNKGLRILRHVDGILDIEKGVPCIDISAVNKVFAIYVDHDNNIWLSLDNKVYLIKGNERCVLNIMNNSDNECANITCITQDNNGGMWFGSKSFVLTDSNIDGLLYKYPLTGLNTKVCKLKSGTLLWGNTMGMVYFDPLKLKQVAFKYKPLITNLEVRCKNEYKPRIIDTHIKCLESLNLNHLENDVIVYVSDGTNYNELNSVKYRMLPNDSTWNSLMNNKLELEKLKAGSYVLQFKSISPNKFNDEITTLKINVHSNRVAAIWWAIGMLGVLIVAITIYYKMYIKYRKNCNAILLSSIAKNEDNKDISKKVREPIKILVIEVYKGSLAQLISLMDNNYIVMILNNGKDAYEQACLNIPDIIVTDINVPIEKDFNFYSSIRKNETLNDIPILIFKDVMDEFRANGEFSGLTNDDDLETKINILFSNKEALKQYHHRQTKGMKISNVNGGVNIDVAVEDAFIQKIINVVYQQIDNPNFNVKQLAEIFNMSQASLYRKVKMLTNNTIINLIMQVRLKKALELLDTNKFNVQEVAEMVGYNDLATFRKYFIEQYHMTPSQYKKDVANKNNKSL